MTTVDHIPPPVASHPRRLPDLVISTGLGGLVAGDGTWLTLGEAIARYRAEGIADSESTIRREVDDAVAGGKLGHYRTPGGHRRVRAADLDKLIAARRNPAKPE